MHEVFVQMFFYQYFFTGFCTYIHPLWIMPLLPSVRVSEVVGMFVSPTNFPVSFIVHNSYELLRRVYSCVCSNLLATITSSLKENQNNLLDWEFADWGRTTKKPMQTCNKKITDFKVCSCQESLTSALGLHYNNFTRSYLLAVCSTLYSGLVH